MNKISLVTAFSLIATTAAADTSLERFETMAEAMSTAMVEMLIKDIESQGGDGRALRELDGMLPPWDDAMREAGGCILDTYEAEVGADEVTAMLDRMEEIIPQMSEMSMDAFTGSDQLDAMLPAGISEDRSLEINRECGMMQLQLESEASDAFMAAMMEAGATIPNND